MSNKITSMSKLKGFAQGQVITLPGWTEEPFVCRVKRISMLGLASKGLIPNTLLSSAQKIFTSKVDDNTDLNQIFKVMMIIAKESLVEPSIKELEEVNLELTDEQLTDLLNYSQGGVNALSSFRKKQADNEDSEHS
ncbi:MAG: hypothetical protein N4A40_00470 [Tissierellales bacterium]|jgi:hypothetical protein|nr:hypothetical protein [Tissierellales bacterium]